MLLRALILNCALPVRAKLTARCGQCEAGGSRWRRDRADHRPRGGRASGRLRTSPTPGSVELHHDPTEHRHNLLAPYQVNERLMALAKPEWDLQCIACPSSAVRK